MATKQSAKKKEPDLAHEVLGYTPGTHRHTAANMYLEGSTAKAVEDACGGKPQRVILSMVQEKGHKVTTTKVDGPGNRKVKVYRIRLKGGRA